MHDLKKRKVGITAAGASLLLLLLLPAHADNFGTTGNEFTIEFVDIGNAGNADDAGAGGGSTFSPYGGVSYHFRMGAYEISQDAITKATTSGLSGVVAGAWTGSQPAGSMTWYEAAAFVNWLNTSTGHQAAYQLTGVTGLTLWTSGEAWQLDGENLYRHKDAFYFLPSEDEWYKAAYHQNVGVTANYWDYTTASNTLPTSVASGTGAGTAVYNKTASADVNNDGGLSAYGTMGQGGNVWEWQESALVAPNDNPSELRAYRGGGYDNTGGFLRADYRGNGVPTTSFGEIGFRVASVPEPSTTGLLIGTGLLWLLRRQGRAFL